MGNNFLWVEVHSSDDDWHASTSVFPCPNSNRAGHLQQEMPALRRAHSALLGCILSRGVRARAWAGVAWAGVA